MNQIRVKYKKYHSKNDTFYSICPLGRARTFDRRLKRPLLYHLSYKREMVYVIKTRCTIEKNQKKVNELSIVIHRYSVYFIL